MPSTPSGHPRPRISASANAATWAAILLGGGAVGTVIALMTGGGSDVVIGIGALTLPLAYLLGLAAWRGLLGAWLATILGRSLLRSRGNEERFRAETIQAFDGIREAGPGALPFTWVFVPVAVGVGLVAAGLVVLVTSGEDVVMAALLVAAASALGMVLRRLARQGRLLLPSD